MKMTMKNELTLKHGMILAAAVLLIAGIAFAGAAAAAKYVDWTAENITTDGGDYIVHVPGDVITNVHTDVFNLQDNLTLDFQYQNVSVGTLTPATSLERNAYACLFPSLYIPAGKVLTIKNLIIDGGNTIGTSSTRAAAIVGFLYNATAKAPTGALILENITIRNIEIVGHSYVGGILGAVYEQAALCKNCTVDSCRITASAVPVGAICGCSSTDAALHIENCSVMNTYIEGIKNSGGFIGTGGIFGSANGASVTLIENTSMENCVVDSPNSGSSENPAGLIVAYTNIAASPITTTGFETACNLIGISSTTGFINVDDCEAINCVVTGSKGEVGGVTGKMISTTSSPAFTITDNLISSCTIVSSYSGGYAGGFAGKLKPAAIASISNNTIANCCVVATNGNAAGFCPAGA